MTQYIVEDNINFYSELYKSLDDSDEDNENICQITGSPLTDKYVTLECKHKFNYTALYTEICRQKFIFKTYDYTSLSKNEKQQYRDKNVDYFIRCPYCRNVQFTLLPFYEDLDVEAKYGINSADIQLKNQIQSINGSETENFCFFLYGVIFKKGSCCGGFHDMSCANKYVGNIPNTNLHYCKIHYKKGFKEFQLAEHTKKMEEKKKLKESILNERQQLMDAKNAERALKGLPPLKRLPPIKKAENVIVASNHITDYMPELEEVHIDLSGQIQAQAVGQAQAVKTEPVKTEPVKTEPVKTEPVNIDTQSSINTGCHIILQSGPNKGKPCGCNKMDNSDLCKRHLNSMAKKLTS